MIGKQIKKYRVHNGLTQQKLAAEAGISLRTLQRLENGKTEPRGDTLIRIAEALEVSLDELVEWKLKEDNTYLTVVHASAFGFLLFPLLGVILPFVLWITKKDQVKDLNQSGKEVINFQLMWTILFFTGIIFSFFWINHVMSTITDIGPSIISRSYTPPQLIMGTLYLYNIVIIMVNTYLVSRRKKTWYYPRINFIR